TGSGRRQDKYDVTTAAAFERAELPEQLRLAGRRLRLGTDVASVRREWIAHDHVMSGGPGAILHPNVVLQFLLRGGARPYAGSHRHDWGWRVRRLACRGSRASYPRCWHFTWLAGQWWLPRRHHNLGRPRRDGLGKIHVMHGQQARKQAQQSQDGRP